ncbi:MAG: O-methyltransferase [Planctomycetota bacterium]
MGNMHTQVDEHIMGFLAEKTVTEDAFSAELRRAALAAGLPEIHIAPEQAAFLQQLMHTMAAKTVVEVGTLGGYSALALARGTAKDGRVISFEIEPAYADFARQWIEKSDQSGRIEVVIGPAVDGLAELPAASVDAVFLDADKIGYVAYLEHSMRILRPGGTLLADNVLAGGHIATGDTETAVAIQAFLDTAQQTPNLQGVVLPLGDGLYFGVKQG